MTADTELRNAIVEQQLHLIDAAARKFFHCLDQLSDAQVWWRPANSLNSVANLVLHVCGNLTQWILIDTHGTADNRDRDAEFAAVGGHTKEDLRESLDGTLDEVRLAIGSVSAEQLLLPRVIQGFNVTRLGAIVHSVTHFVGHTHQAIQVTRLQLGKTYRFEWSPDGGDRSKLPI